MVRFPLFGIIVFAIFAFAIGSAIFYLGNILLGRGPWHTVDPEDCAYYQTAADGPLLHCDLPHDYRRLRALIFQCAPPDGRPRITLHHDSRDIIHGLHMRLERVDDDGSTEVERRTYPIIENPGQLHHEGETIDTQTAAWAAPDMATFYPYIESLRDPERRLDITPRATRGGWFSGWRRRLDSFGYGRSDEEPKPKIEVRIRLTSVPDADAFLRTCRR